MVIRGYLPTMADSSYLTKPMFFKPGGRDTF